jgi:excisionase family DNA binding protein
MRQVLVRATISADDYLFGYRLAASSQGEWISAEEVARALGCTGQIIRNMCKVGKLRHTRAGNRYRVHASELHDSEVPHRTAARDPVAIPPLVSSSPEGPCDAKVEGQTSTSAHPGQPPGDGWEQKRPGGRWSRPAPKSEEEARLHDLWRRTRYNKRTGRVERDGKPID